MASADVRAITALVAVTMAAAALPPRAAEAASSSGEPSACGKGFVVYFANGVRTTPDGALGSVLLTHDVLGDSYNGEPIVDYRRALNATTGLGDYYRVLKQKLAELGFFRGYVSAKILFALASSDRIPQDANLDPSQLTAIQNVVLGALADLQRVNGSSGGYYDANVAMHVQQFEADLSAGQKVLVVAHSQGNLYANAAYDRLVADGANVGAIAIASVASAANVAKSGEYVTSTADLVIASLGQYFPTLPANLTLAPAPAYDPLGHGYSEIYLNPELAAFDPVLEMFQRLLGRLQASNPTPSCPDAGAPEGGVPEAGARDAGAPASADAATDACGAAVVPNGNRDDGAAAHKYCDLLSPAEVSATVGIPGLSGPVILQSSTDVVAGSVVVEGATCAYPSPAASQAVLISFEVTTPVPGAVQAIVSQAASGFSSAGCGVSAGASSFTAVCPAGCGAPVSNVVGVGVKETSYIQISSAYASQPQESTLLDAYAARLP
jgi:hypothetical protein